MRLELAVPISLLADVSIARQVLQQRATDLWGGMIPPRVEYKIVPSVPMIAV